MTIGEFVFINPLPRKGTETHSLLLQTAHRTAFINPLPRKGTETNPIIVVVEQTTFINPLPRKGTETVRSRRA